MAKLIPERASVSIINDHNHHSIEFISVLLAVLLRDGGEAVLVAVPAGYYSCVTVNQVDVDPEGRLHLSPCALISLYEEEQKTLFKYGKITKPLMTGGCETLKLL